MLTSPTRREPAQERPVLQTPAAARANHVTARMIGVMLWPRKTYAGIIAGPHWLGALLVVLGATVIPTVLLGSTDVGRRAAVDQQLQVLESFGRRVTQAQYQEMVRRSPNAGNVLAAAQLIGLPVGMFALTAILHGLLGRRGAAPASVAETFAVVVYSSTIPALRTVVSAPLAYARETLASPTNLAMLVPFFDENTFGGRLFGSLDVFVVWWMANLAIGLSVLYRRRAAPIAVGLVAAYGVLALGVAVAKSLLAGS
ncbi:MAG: YIP1 family protein [Verrucomicrobiota bacterium]